MRVMSIEKRATDNKGPGAKIGQVRTILRIISPMQVPDLIVPRFKLQAQSFNASQPRRNSALWKGPLVILTLRSNRPQV